MQNKWQKSWVKETAKSRFRHTIIFGDICKAAAEVNKETVAEGQEPKGTVDGDKTGLVLCVLSSEILYFKVINLRWTDPPTKESYKMSVDR
jgi:hypothetical protein